MTPAYYGFIKQASPLGLARGAGRFLFKNPGLGHQVRETANVGRLLGGEVRHQAGRLASGAQKGVAAAGRLGQNLGKRWMGIDPSQTVAEAFRAAPFKHSLSTLWGSSKFPHIRKIQTGVIGSAIAAPAGAGVGHVMNLDDDMYNRASSAAGELGQELSRSDYNRGRRKIMWEGVKQTLGATPSADPQGVAASMARNFGIPYAKEKTRQAIAGQSGQIPFSNLRLRSFLSPQREVLMNNSGMSRLRTGLANSIFDPRSMSGILREGSEGLWNDYGDRPEVLANIGADMGSNYAKTRWDNADASEKAKAAIVSGILANSLR